MNIDKRGVFLKLTPQAPASAWHRFKRRLFAKPVLVVDVHTRSYWLAWQFTDGNTEVVNYGPAGPGAVIPIPSVRTEVIWV